MGATRTSNGTLTTAAVRARGLLIIEDDAPIRRALRNALSEVADRLLEAPTGREGIDLAATARPDLIVLDLGLPDLAGLDVCREIRSWSRAPIVVLSARHSDAEKVQLLNAGADDYVTKPFSTSEFVARVGALLRRARLPAADDVPTVVQAYGLTIDLVHRRVTRGEVQIRQLNTAEDLVGAAVRQTAGFLKDRPVETKIDFTEPALVGWFDFVQSLRILSNLLSNAAHYTPPSSPIELSVHRYGAGLVFAVADRGPGIPVGEQERIFEPFYRPAGAPADVGGGGAGLGLAIARRLAELQGGALAYQARPGGGSVFTLRLPAEAPASAFVRS